MYIDRYIYTANIQVYILTCVELYMLIYITWTRLYVLYSWCVYVHCVYVHWHIRHRVDERGECTSYTYMYSLSLGNLWTKTACARTQVHVHRVYSYILILICIIYSLWHTRLLVDEPALSVHPNIYLASMYINMYYIEYVDICINTYYLCTLTYVTVSGQDLNRTNTCI